MHKREAYGHYEGQFQGWGLMMILLGKCSVIAWTAQAQPDSIGWQVAVNRQKLLGLKAKGSMAKDDTLMADVKLKPRQKIMMMG